MVIETSAQVNLIPNPSFEDIYSCPTTFGAIDQCVDWFGTGYTPDILNSCSSTATNMPNCAFGFQYAHSGNSMAGIVTWRYEGTICGTCREYVGCQLLHPLQIGVKYYLSFFTNYSHYHPYSAVASNNIGMQFSNFVFDNINWPPLNNFTQLNSDNIIIDSIGWTKISGSFIADSSYSYLYLGNFFINSQTDTLGFSSQVDLAYYYLDDICVTTDSVYNETWTIVEERNPSKGILIGPNPIIDPILKINTDLIAFSFELYDYQGRKIFKKENCSFDQELNVENLSSGFYFISINSAIIHSTYKLFKP